MQGSKSKDGETLKSLINYITLIMGLVHAYLRGTYITEGRLKKSFTFVTIEGVQGGVRDQQQKNVFDF